MANTTNFGWETPDDTDLVKDGAAAMRTLGNAIDTSFVDLKGGTTGQILSKASNTDLDYSWITPNPGDITSVGVTSPITGGGTSGDVTIGIQDGTTAQKGAVQLEDSTSSTSTTKAATPNSVKSAYDLANGAIAKTLTTTTGDIIYASSANTPARLGIGSTGQVLTVSGGIPSWATASSTPTFVGCSVYLSGAVTIANGTETTINWDAEHYDTDSIHSTSSNTSRLTVPTGKGGKWLMVAHCEFGDGGSAGYMSVNVYKNGDLLNYNYMYRQASYASALNTSNIYDLAAGDYIELKFTQNSGGNLGINNGTTRTNVAFSFLGA